MALLPKEEIRTLGKILQQQNELAKRIAALLHDPLSAEDQAKARRQHDRTKRWARRAHRAMQAMGQTRSVDLLMRELADRHDVSKKTPEKWLMHRNDFYEPGGSIDERFRRLQRSIQTIIRFTETP